MDLFLDCHSFDTFMVKLVLYRAENAIIGSIERRESCYKVVRLKHKSKIKKERDFYEKL